MGSGEVVSAAINLLIAAYLTFIYPRILRRQFRAKPAVPPLFSKLMKLAPAAGILLAVGTVLYVILRLAGVIEIGMT